MQPAAYALLPRMNAVARPIVFPDVAALADYIERTRGGQGLDMAEVDDLHFQWHATGGGIGVDSPPPGQDRGVQIWTTLLDGGRDRCLGWAWLNGYGLEALMAALRHARTRAQQRAASAHARSIGDSSPLRTRQAYAAMSSAGWPGPKETYRRTACARGAGARP